MRGTLFLQKTWVRVALVLGVATIMGLFQASQGMFFWTLEGKQVPWSTTLIRGVADWYVWALWTPLVFWLSRRYPLEHPRVASRTILHGAMSVLLADLTILLMLPVCQWTQPPGTFMRTADDVLRWLFTVHFILYLWIYWAIVGLSHAVSYYRKFQERQLRASQLEARLAQARLQVLKMQLHPHFLFNTLNAISALMHQDVELADRMIAQLGRLLRLSLENEGAQEVPLGQELDFVQAYLEIEQARLGPRLTVATEIDPETFEARIPNLILQPLVENAIRHGIAPRPEGGKLTIRSQRNDGQLRLEIEDDGPGLAAKGLPHEGIGLSNTRRRLKQLYAEQHRLEFDSGTSGGLCVRLVLPFDAAARSSSEPDILDSASFSTEAIAAAVGDE